MATNVFGYENKAIVPYQLSDQPASIARINVLLIHEETKSHYVGSRILTVYFSIKRNMNIVNTFARDIYTVTREKTFYNVIS